MSPERTASSAAARSTAETASTPVPAKDSGATSTTATSSGAASVARPSKNTPTPMRPSTRSSMMATETMMPRFFAARTISRCAVTATVPKEE